MSDYNDNDEFEDIPTDDIPTPEGEPIDDAVGDAWGTEDGNSQDEPDYAADMEDTQAPDAGPDEDLEYPEDPGYASDSPSGDEDGCDPEGGPYDGDGEADMDADAAAEDPFSPDENGAAGEGGTAEDAAPDPEEGAGETESLSTDQKDEESLHPYSQKKESPSSVIKSKPNVLNRQLILYAIGGVAIFSLIFATFILPILQTNSAKKTDKKKQQPAAVSPADYYSLVPRSDARNLTGPSLSGDPNSDPNSDMFWNEESDEEILNNLPPIDDRYQNASQSQTQAAARTVSSSGGGGYVRPDTRNDKLHGKRIDGIKGLTPGQSQYLSGPGQIPQGQPGQGPQGGDSSNPYAQFGMPPKEEYMAQMLAVQQQQQQYYGNNSNNSYTAQNDQSGKMAFYNQGRENFGNGYWLSPASIWQGTIFEAALTSRINTDLPGECTAVITKNVYSTQNGQYLLIPQNSRLLGTYNSSVSYSQKRVQVGWHTLIRPDGYYINLGNMQAADPRGATGLPGIINEHPFQYLKAILLLSAMNIVNSELGYTMADTNNQYVQNVMANTQDVANQLGAKIIDRALDVQPTITIREGTKINIVANNTLVLPPMQPYPVTYPYRRNWNR
jgi:type IV secretion system protein VirB10